MSNECTVSHTFADVHTFDFHKFLAHENPEGTDFCLMRPHQWSISIDCWNFLPDKTQYESPKVRWGPTNFP